MIEQRKTLKTRLLRFAIFIFFIVIPFTIFFLRHAKMQTKIPSWVTIVAVGVVIYLIKKANRKYKILEAKEIEDDKRTATVILFFYRQFVVIYLIVMIGFKYVQINFSSITWTMIYVGISLLIGGILRIHLANTTGL